MVLMDERQEVIMKAQGAAIGDDGSGSSTSEGVICVVCSAEFLVSNQCRNDWKADLSFELLLLACFVDNTQRAIDNG